MSSRSLLEQSLRRLKPEKHSATFSRRERSSLPWFSTLRAPLPKLLLDTTVYIDVLQGRLPQEAEITLRAASLWHCTVTESELAALSGLLDPRHPDTAKTIAQLAATIEARPAHRTLNPDRDIWRDAGVLAGLIARLQHYGKQEQRKTLNDALIFLTAAKHGCAVLTRNIGDFDLLMQLYPSGQAIFYDRTISG